MKVKKGRILPIKERKIDYPEFKKNTKKSKSLYRSFIYRNLTFFKPDPRPVFDKNYISFCLKEIKLFLRKNIESTSFSTKFLFPLRNKDFFKIIFFLFKKIDKNFKIRNKPEDDIPRLLRLLGYPVSITKSTLSSMVNSNKFPFYLNCLNWIVELCHYDLKTISEKRFMGLKNRRKTLIWNYLIKSYNKFLSKKIIKDRFNNIIKLILTNHFNFKQKVQTDKVKRSKKSKKIHLFFKIILYSSLWFKWRIKYIKKIKKNHNLSVIILENIQTDFLVKFENKLKYFFKKKFKICKNKNLHTEVFLQGTRYHIKRTIKIIHHKILFLESFKKDEIKIYLNRNLNIDIKIFKSLISLLFTRKKSNNLIKSTRFPVIKLKFLDILFQNFFFIFSEQYIFFIEKKILSIIHNIYQQKVKLFFEIVVYLKFFPITNYQNEFDRQINSEHLILYTKTILRFKTEKIEKYYEDQMFLTKDIKKRKGKIFFCNLKKNYCIFKLRQLIFWNLLKKNFDKIFNCSVSSVFLVKYLIKKEKIDRYYFPI